MKKETLLLTALSVSAVAVLAVSAFSSNSAMSILKVEAEQTVETITFSRSTSIIHKNKFNTTFEDKTSNGTTMYLSAGTGIDLEHHFYSDYIAYMTSGHSLTITADSNGSNRQEFQCLKSITLNLAEPNDRKFTLDVSFDGMSYQSYENLVFNDTNRKTTLVENAKTFTLTYHNDNSYTAKLDSIVIEYACTRDFIEGPKPIPTQADAPNNLHKIYDDIGDEPYGGAPTDGFTANRIAYKNRALDPNNYACVYNAEGEVVKYLKKGLYYTSVNDVANYILAFKELPANYEINRYGGRYNIYDECGEYGRQAAGFYGLDYSGTSYDGADKYPHGVLPKSTDGNFFVLDIGWKWYDSRTTSYSSSPTTSSGPLRMIVFFEGVRAEGEELNTSHYNDGNPVIFYTPDNFQSAFEYANYYGGWSVRFNQGEAYTPLTTK